MLIFTMYLKSLVPRATLDTATEAVLQVDNLLLEIPGTSREACLGTQSGL